MTTELGTAETIAFQPSQPSPRLLPIPSGTERLLASRRTSWVIGDTAPRTLHGSCQAMPSKPSLRQSVATGVPLRPRSRPPAYLSRVVHQRAVLPGHRATLSSHRRPFAKGSLRRPILPPYYQYGRARSEQSRDGRGRPGKVPRP